MALESGRRLRLESDGLVHARGHFDSSKRQGGVTLCGRMYSIAQPGDLHQWHDAAVLVNDPLTCIVCAL